MIKQQWLNNVLQVGALPFEVDDGIYQDGLLLHYNDHIYYDNTKSSKGG